MPKHLIALALAFLTLPCLLSAQTLLHRYSFITNADDSVGGAAWNGTIVAPSGGTAATIANGLVLPGGGTGAFSGYLSLPNGILTATTNLTVEVWATQNTQNSWATIWCFDNSTAQNFQLCPRPDPGRNNGNMIVDDNPNNDEDDLNTPTLFPSGSEEYVSVTYNNSNLVENLYYNGVLDGTVTLPNTTYCPGTFGGATGTTQNWLGRDTYNDLQFQGTVYELRIWDGVVSQRYLAATAILGAGILETNLTPTEISLTAGPSVIITGTEQASITVQLQDTGIANLPATGDATNWVSSNPSVLAVNANGVITGVGVGSATVSATVGGVTGTSASITVTGPQALVHRYSFVSDASDSVGGPTWNGTLVAPTNGSLGTAATIANGLTLPGGGGPGYSGYVTLPAGVLTNTTSITVETWVTQNAANTWAEIWDFANIPTSSQSFGLIPDPGNNSSHLEVSFNPQFDEQDLQSGISFPTSNETYVAITYNNFSLVGNLYTNGSLIGSHTFPNTTYAPGSYSVTQSNMLGQDIYPDPQFQGSIYEFRIWNGALSPTYVAVANAAGPSVVVTNVTPLSLSLTVNSTTMIGTQTQQADVTGSFNQAANVDVTQAATNWISSNPSVLTVNSSGLITAITVGSATVSATVNGVVATSPSITVSTSRPTAQGPANVVAVPGDTVTFAVSALGGSLTYQWSEGATQIPGATNATLVLTNISFASAGTYSVLVTNSLGSTNPSATLTVVSQLLQHRYSFVSDASDSVGGPAFKGTLVGPTTGTAATINNGLSLPGNTGGGFGVSGYVSLPPGILTNTSSITVECWLTQNSQNTWAEPWDFGSDGSHNFALITYPANNGNNMEVAFTPHGNEIDLQSTLSFPSGSEQYVTVTFNSGTLVGDLYTNGALVATHTYPDASYTPGTISLPNGTSENMLGNDVYGDEQFSGTIYEFRIWDGAVSPLYLAVAAAAGPSVVVTNLTPLSVSVSVTNSTMIQGQTQPATVLGNFVDASGVDVTRAATNWISSNPAALTVDTSGNVTAVGIGNATISATVSGVTATSASITVPTSAPVITVEPATNETLLVGGTLHATLANIGPPPFTYFWFTNGSSAPISVSSTPALSVPDLQPGNAGTYSCIVSNQYGTELSSNLVLAVVAPTTYEQVLLELNPLALWPLNESSGTTAYDIIGGNNGTYTGTFTLGQAGPTNAFFDSSLAVQFTGAGYVDVPEGPFNITGAITVVAWIQPLALNGFEDIIGHGDPSWRMDYVSTSGNYGANDGTSAAGDATDPTALLDHNWHMIAYTYSGNTSQANNGLLYVDGVLVGTNSVTATPPGDNLDVWIGGAPDYGTATGSRLMAGNIADAAVFSRVLTPAQVQGVYNSTFVVSQPPAPTITHVGVSAGNIIIRGTNNAGPGGTYHLLASTNAATPLSNWTVLTSGSFDGNGNVNSTNAINPGTPRSFYILQAP